VDKLRSCDARYARHMDIDNHLQIHPFYDIIRRSRDIIINRSLLWLIRVVALPDTTYQDTICMLCNKQYTDIVVHVVTKCPTLCEARNILWDFLVNEMDVELSVELSYLSDEICTDILCGRPWSGFDDKLSCDEKDTLFSEIAVILHKHFSKGFMQNYTWFH